MTEQHPQTKLQLNELNDHDLLVRIAVQVERLPEFEQRLRVLEVEVARLRTWAPVIVAGITGVATVLATLISNFF